MALKGCNVLLMGLSGCAHVQLPERRRRGLLTMAAAPHPLPFSDASHVRGALDA